MAEPADDLGNDDLAVEVSDDGLVARATIDRPDVRNALNDAVISGFVDLLRATDGSDLRVIVVRGGGGTFCSGGDLQGMADAGDPTVMERRRTVSGLSRLFDHLTGADALTVAAVEGYCLAGGCGLAAACDFVLAADDAEFGTPEVNVGLFPMQAMAPIARAVGEKKTLKLLFTGEFVDARGAEDIGLVTDVLDADAFDDELDDYVDTLAGNSPVMISMGKEAYYAQRDMSFAEAHRYAKEMLALLMESEDHAEGVSAFMEDRDPEWSRR